MIREPFLGVCSLIFLAVASCACSSTLSHTAKIMDQDVSKTADEYVSTMYPDFDKSGKAPVIIDAGDFWEFTYELPDYMIGGAPVVVLDKRTGIVVRSFRTQ